MATIVDYGMGNLRSVEKALQKVGANPILTSNPNDIRSADILIVPGVGAFDDACYELKKRKLFKEIVSYVKSDRPYLGFCLGYQLLFSSSDEGSEKGFDVFGGKVKRFPNFVKAPHMGWNRVKDLIRPEMAENLYYYFVHSYYVVPNDTSIIAGSTDYAFDFASMIRTKNVIATQFHPEKSQNQGLRFLKKSLEYLSKK